MMIYSRRSPGPSRANSRRSRIARQSISLTSACLAKRSRASQRTSFVATAHNSFYSFPLIIPARYARRTAAGEPRHHRYDRCCCVVDVMQINLGRGTCTYTRRRSSVMCVRHSRKLSKSRPTIGVRLCDPKVRHPSRGGGGTWSFCVAVFARDRRM